MYVLNCIYFSPQILPALCVLIHHTDVNVSKFSLFNYICMCMYACTGLPLWYRREMKTVCTCIRSYFTVSGTEVCMLYVLYHKLASVKNQPCHKDAGSCLLTAMDFMVTLYGSLTFESVYTWWYFCIFKHKLIVSLNARICIYIHKPNYEKLLIFTFIFQSYLSNYSRVLWLNLNFSVLSFKDLRNICNY